MANKNAVAVSKIVEILDGFETEDINKTLQAVRALLVSNGTDVNIEDSPGVNPAPLPKLAQQWIKTNTVAQDDLLQVFHFDESGVQIIAGEMPGKNQKNSTINAYVLQGIAALLQSGEPTFEDKAARSLCKHFACYSESNHAAYVNEGKSNYFTRAGDGSWKLTVPGLKRGAEIIREIVHN